MESNLEGYKFLNKKKREYKNLLNVLAQLIPTPKSLCDILYYELFLRRLCPLYYDHVYIPSLRRLRHRAYF